MRAVDRRSKVLENRRLTRCTVRSARGYRTYSPLFRLWLIPGIIFISTVFFFFMSVPSFLMRRVPSWLCSGRSMTVEEIVNSWNVQLEQDATTFTNEAVKV